jgi:heat shock protein HslJ
MTRSFKILIGALAAIIVFAFGAFAQNTDLASGQWKLTHLNGKAVGQTQAYIEIDPAAGRFNGNAGCNRIFGTVKVSRRNITFSRVGSTRMACIDSNVMRLEGDFTKALPQATSFRKAGDVLSIYAGSRRILNFKADPKGSGNASSSDVKLEDKKWFLETIGGKAVGALGKEAFINFDAAKRGAGGNTSCNVYGGEYTVKDDSISIKQVISTMRACIEDDRMNIERSFLNGLRDASRFEIKGEKLYLYKGNELLLTFHAEDK